MKTIERMNEAGLDEIKQWIMSLGPEAYVEEPKRLRVSSQWRKEGTIGNKYQPLYKKVDRSLLEWGITIPKDLYEYFQIMYDPNSALLRRLRKNFIYFALIY